MTWEMSIRRIYWSDDDIRYKKWWCPIYRFDNSKAISSLLPFTFFIKILIILSLSTRGLHIGNRWYIDNMKVELMNILKLMNYVDIAQMKQILFATNLKKAFIIKNCLKVITCQVSFIRDCIFFYKVPISLINHIILINNWRKL